MPLRPTLETKNNKLGKEKKEETICGVTNFLRKSLLCVEETNQDTDAMCYMNQAKRKISKENCVISFPVSGERSQGEGRPRKLESSPCLGRGPREEVGLGRWRAARGRLLCLLSTPARVCFVLQVDWPRGSLDSPAASSHLPLGMLGLELRVPLCEAFL